MPFVLLFVLLNIPQDLSKLTVPITPFVEAAELSTNELKAMATEIAMEHKLNVPHFLKTIECESNWDTRAVGDGGLSHGLVQLYYPTRDWGIATTSAYEPRLSMEIMAEAWQKNLASKWTCWRNLPK
jgi:hypothetical protein